MSTKIERAFFGVSGPCFEKGDADAAFAEALGIAAIQSRDASCRRVDYDGAEVGSDADMSPESFRNVSIERNFACGVIDGVYGFENLSGDVAA